MPKWMKIILIIAVVILLLSTVFISGCIFNLSSTTRTPVEGLDTGLMQEAWDKITANYVEPTKIDTVALNEGAVGGLVRGLDDPYSYYLNPTDYQLTQSNFQSSFGGIGATISTNKDGQPIIVTTMDGSPAQKAGILPQDTILAIDGKPTEGLAVDQVVSQVRGEIGTTVKLLILHPDATLPVEISIVRAEINPTTVSYRMEGNVAYIQLTNFYQSSNDEINNALKALDLKNAKGIVLDLRNNLGGYVNTMVDIASHFIKSGVIITMRDNQGQTTSQSVNRNGVFTDLPLVVLVNQYSASASEVLSGALQDYGRATIAGTKTFGKGSYDTFFTLSDGSGIYLTVGRWLTPKGREIEGVGITPDQVLTQTGDDAIKWAVDYLDSK
jgi:carboxyl-terminal processing protease